MHSNFITNILNVEVNEVLLQSNLNDDKKKELSDKYNFNNNHKIHVNFEEEYGVNTKKATGIFYLTLNLLDYKFSRFLKISYTFYFELNQNLSNTTISLEDYAKAARLPMSLHIRNHIQLITSLESSKDPIVLPFNFWSVKEE